MYSDIPFHFGMPEGQIRGVRDFARKLVATATTLEISEKEVQINHLHTKRFHRVKKLRKSVQ